MRSRLGGKLLHHYGGWKPDLPDHRDKIFAAIERIEPLPSFVDLREFCPPVYDQGQLGSCTGNGIAFAIQFEMMKQNPAMAFAPSRLFIYYNERAMEGDINQDNGAQIRDGIKSVAQLGVTSELDWPYDISKFAEKPLPECYANALKYKVNSYQRVGVDLNQMKNCLAAGFPFVFGMTVYESFESETVASTGMVPMPGPDEQVLGGHCVAAVGYDDSKSVLLCRNSWGPGWGMQGYFALPYAFLANLSDLWTIRLVA